MSGKLVNDINRETIDKLPSMLWLTLQSSHFGFSLFFVSPKQRIMINYISIPAQAAFPLNCFPSKMLVFFSISFPQAECM